MSNFDEELTTGWEDEKIFGIEKDNRLAKVSKISFFMHGANKGKIKRGDGLENYPDEGISAESFDILVSNPPYSIKNFKKHLKLKNKFEILEKIEATGSEIETMFVEKISQLLKAGGIASVILPSSILNKDGKSFVYAREIILQNFYVRAIAGFGSKTFSSTGTKTNILFLEKISDPPEKFKLFSDTVNRIFSQNFYSGRIDEKIFDAWLKKIKIEKNIYQKFLRREKAFFDWKNDVYFGEYFQKFVDSMRSARDFLEKYHERLFANIKIDKNIFCEHKNPELENLNRKFYEFAHEIEREKIQYFAQTFEQKTLIISAPDDSKEQEKFLGYSWSNRKGDEGIKIKSEGGLLFDKNNRRAENKLAFAVRKIFFGEEVQIADAKNYYNYFNLSDLIDFSGTNFTKIIKTSVNATFKNNFPILRLSDVCSEILAGGDVPVGKFSKEITDEYKIPIFTNGTAENALYGYTNSARINKNSLTISARGSIGFCEIRKAPFYPAIRLIVATPNEEKILLEYLKISVSNVKIYSGGGIIKQLTVPMAKNIEIPVPPLEEQKKIVGEFEEIDEKILSCEEKINLCDAEIKNKFSEMFDDVEEKISLGKICTTLSGGTPDTKNKNFYDGKIAWITTIALGKNFIDESDATKFISEDAIKNSSTHLIPKNTLLFGLRVGVGKSSITKIPICTNQDVVALLDIDEKIFEKIYLKYFLDSQQKYFDSIKKGMTIQGITSDELKKILIPVPPKEIQKKFAEFVESAEGEKKSAKNLREKYLSEREALVEKYFR